MKSSRHGHNINVMKLKPILLADTLVLLALTALAWGIAGWILALLVCAIGALLMRRGQTATVESDAEAAEGRRRTYAQFQKDLHDPTGTSAISIFRDLP